MKNELKKKINKKKLTVGSWLQLPDTYTAEIMARAGFEWLAIDLEHGLIDLESAFKLIQIIDLSGTIPLVRLNINDASTIRRVMDAGAGGVIVPMVNTAKEAQAAVNALKYPPAGKRSFGLGRAHDYGGRFESYIANSNDDCILAVQIELIVAVSNLDEILKVKGIDAIIIGPYDLSGSLGKPGDFRNKEFKEAVSTIIEKTKRSSAALGFHLVHPDENEFKKKISEGFSFIAYGMDTIYLSSAAKKSLDGVKNAAN